MAEITDKQKGLIECMNEFCREKFDLTDKQKGLIECMNEFCREKFDFTGRTRQEASAYISRNIEEYKLLTMDEWQIKYS